MSLCGSGDFIWEHWRNSFICRLARHSKWQRQNCLEYSAVSATEEVSPKNSNLLSFLLSEQVRKYKFGLGGRLIEPA